MSLCAHSLLSISMSQWSKNKMITAQKRKPKLETMWREENNQKETQLRIESDLKEKVGMCTLMEKKKNKCGSIRTFLGFASKEREKER